MAKYVKASDSMVVVKDQKGKTHRVTERAYNIVYKAKGYTLVEAPETTENQNDGSELDYFTLTREELQEIKNDDLKEFLDKEEIQYKSNANKEDLIDLILGE
ncbi:hypothetical protein J7E38_13620 [Bacillus sp. ISL-35]|uniref:hypothetical protein n=1 Tax=Bacillus sp. ISL-35 TaxID=2819122 RepID=UPI001BE8AB76|nr:hypothetical protein [Bacillus sp. ISL-35]MBT2680048.1 hypothetical protein [Bacillus sp. ISL-35]MBT2702975.1 hypothetical protein [Chryseobacterium sp. ISL-80]